jgi:peptidoglycan/xylan/chitin deacetylase (PgdA/CDA1 family)
VTAPHVNRPPFAWPGGRRGAVAVTFDMDAESVMLAVDRSWERRPSLMSHQRYGPVVGVPRLLEILEARSIRATFFVPGFTAERHPGAVRSVADAGHEIAHHGYLHEPLVGRSRNEERTYLERGLEALDRVAGVRPEGYRAPWWELGEHTLELLGENGFRYDSSLFQDDRPHLIGTGPGPSSSSNDRRGPGGSSPGDDRMPPLVELPVTWALDDWERYAFWPDVTGTGVIARPSEVLDAWWEELDAIVGVGGCAIVTMHPFLSGRPARARALATLLDRVLEREDVWVATCGEIAEHAAAVLGGPEVDVFTT